MTATDTMIRRHETAIEEKLGFIEQLTSKAESANRKLSDQEKQLIADAQAEVNGMEDDLKLLGETSRIAVESRNTARKYDTAIAGARANGATGFEYRSAGEYLVDLWAARADGQGQGRKHRERLETYEMAHRAAAHQTTADNLGVIPQLILDPVINFIDASRPLVTSFGPKPIPGGPSFIRPKVTQHTAVGPQSAEKAELPSQKMLITRNTVNVATYGGYVNVSKQDIDWSSPNIMDLVVNDLASVYAIETEEAFATALVAAATPGGTPLTGAMTQQQVAAVIWGAAGAVYAATKGQGRLILAVSPDMLNVVGPIFAPVNPQNAQSSGFVAGGYGQGVVGAISGISVVMSAALPSGTAIVTSTAAAEVYDQRGGTLSVIEPSVLGTQVAYYGYFGSLVVEATGIVELAAP